MNILKEAQKECEKIQDEGLKESLLAKLGDGIKIVHGNIEQDQGLAVSYLMSTSEIETAVLNPFEDFTFTKKDE